MISIFIRLWQDQDQILRLISQSGEEALESAFSLADLSLRLLCTFHRFSIKKQKIHVFASTTEAMERGPCISTRRAEADYIFDVWEKVDEYKT